MKYEDIRTKEGGEDGLVFGFKKKLLDCGFFDVIKAKNHQNTKLVINCTRL